MLTANVTNSMNTTPAPFFVMRVLVLAVCGLGSTLSRAAEPNDPRFHQLYGLASTQTDLAWDFTRGSARVVVGILDTGIDYTHPDLYLNIWLNEGEIPPTVRERLLDTDGDGVISFWDLNDSANLELGLLADLNGTGFIDGGDVLSAAAGGGWSDGDDNDGNGFVDDLMGWDFGEDDNDPAPTEPHGTQVAGFVGAIGNNGLGVVGVNWKVRLMNVKQTFDGGGTTVQRTGEALIYAASNGARVSNLSSGLFLADLFPSELVEAIAAMRFIEEVDHLLVCAAGNESLDIDLNPKVPASLPSPNILTVTATKRPGKLAPFSNTGPISVDLGAPGQTVWTTDLNGTYSNHHGTSFAAPHVAGAVGLILSLYPDLTASQLRNRILDRIDPDADLEGITVTGGRLNVLRAIQASE